MVILLVSRCCWISAGRSTPRAYQDERFSYVVLRRGRRPGDAPDVSIRRQLINQPDLDPDEYRSKPNALNASRARRLVRLLFHLANVSNGMPSGLQRTLGPYLRVAMMS